MFLVFLKELFSASLKRKKRNEVRLKKVGLFKNKTHKIVA